jgi:hypothetical protein
MLRRIDIGSVEVKDNLGTMECWTYPINQSHVNSEQNQDRFRGKHS